MQCATLPEPAATAKRSLEFQGGPFTRADAVAFIQTPGASAAVQLRRWDNLAKIPGATTPELRHFMPVLLSGQRSRSLDH